MKFRPSSQSERNCCGGTCDVNTAETITSLSEQLLLKHNGLLFGQCLTAVGWVGGTIPHLTEEQGIVELSMADVAGGSIAVGAALSGRRVIYVVRYQGFMWYNAPSLVNYAAKSKDMWGIACPLLVRAIAMDGHIGPVASSSHHSLVARMPGLTVASPMDGREWREVFEWWLAHDDPVYVSESRKSFSLTASPRQRTRTNVEIVLIAIGSARLTAEEAAQRLEANGVSVATFGILWIKPLEIPDWVRLAVRDARATLVIDSDFEQCSVGMSVAYSLQHETGCRVDVLGLDERSAGFSKETDNTTPSPQKILSKLRQISSMIDAL